MGQYGPDALLGADGRPVLGASVAVPVGYTASVDGAGNLTVTGPEADAVPTTITPLGGSPFTVNLRVEPSVADVLLRADADTKFLPRTDATGTYAPIGSTLTQAAAKAAYVPSIIIDAALGDGTTDATSAIQAALNSANTAGGGVVYVPKGTYLVSATLTVYSNTVLRGAGRASVLKMANATNIVLVTIATGASKVTLDGLTLDGNRANQTSSGSYCLRVEAVDQLRLRNCVLTSARGRLIFAVATAAYMTNVSVEGCTFADAGTVALEVRAARGWSIANNLFTSWGQVTAASPAIACSQGSAGFFNDEIAVVGNTFRNTTGSQFAIESQSSSWLEVATGWTIAGNVFDGNGLAANGVSGWFFRSTMSGNTHVNGAGTHRSGYEIVGQEVVISGNYIENGIIALASNSGGTTRQVSIVGNTISNAAANGAGGIGIQMGGSAGELTDVSVIGNSVHLTNASPQAGIYLGTYGTQGVIKRILVSGNRVYGPGGAGNGVRVLAAAGTTGLLIVQNTVANCGTGVITGSDANTDEVTISGNDLRGNTAPLSGAPTGTYRYFGNVLANDAYPSSKDITVTGVLDHDGGSVGFYGVAPTARAAAIASPTADVAALKTAVDAIRVALINIGITA